MALLLLPRHPWPSRLWNGAQLVDHVYIHTPCTHVCSRKHIKFSCCFSQLLTKPTQGGSESPGSGVSSSRQLTPGFQPPLLNLPLGFLSRSPEFQEPPCSF